MNDNENDALEKQIGNLGAPEGSTNKNEETPTLTGKKLKHITKKNTLSEEDEQSMKDFLARTDGKSVFQSGPKLIGSQAEIIENDGDAPISGGWIPIDRAGLGERDIFYPAEWEFRVKPASVSVCKKWSQIDENARDVKLQIWNVFNEIIKQCVKIQTPTGSLNWGHINSWDRFWFVKRIHDYTYAKSNKIEFTDICENCGEELTFSLETNSLLFETPDESVIDKHWDTVEYCWKIDPKEYDMTGPVIKLYTPTMGKDDIIVQWAYAQAQNGRVVDEGFIKFLPWLMKSAPKDLKLADKIIRECERQYKSWDMETFSFYDEIIRNIEVVPEEKLRTVCPHCGEEVRSAAQFQNGFKSLFSMETRHKKFGTK